MIKRLLLTILLLAWLVLVVRHRIGMPDHSAAAYSAGGGIGLAFVLIVVPLLVARVWVGKRVSVPLRAHPARAGAVLTALVVVLGLGLSAGGPSDAERTSAQVKAAIAGGCAQGRTRAYCECLSQELVDRRGIDTTEKMEDLDLRLREAIARRDRAAIPSEFRDAARICKRAS